MDLEEPTFGRWLQQRRLQLGLTQEALGKQVGLSADMIRKIEGEARRPSPETVTVLARSLQVPEAEHAAFLRFARGESSRPPGGGDIEPAAPWREGAPPLQNLPRSPTRLIGREQAITRIAALLEQPDVQLVTLLGPGGIGKTRLATAVAEASRAAFPGGTYFVNLAPIGDPALVLSTIAQTLDVNEQGGQTLQTSVQAFLRDRQVLLLLDNFEQVLAAGLVVADLLQGAERLKVLVTSRAPLRLRGEQEVMVEPLTVPEPPPPPLEVLSQYGAVQLFIARAREVKANFEVTNANAAAVAEICARLDGLPLAIELAAARVKMLSPDALLQRLGSRLAMLTGGAHDLPARQQTLRNTVEWSYQLLTGAEQQLFRHLSVFVGGCTLEAMEAVCAAAVAPPSREQEWAAASQELDVLNGVQSLLEKSLLRQADGVDGEPRSTMLEMIREYALERAAAHGDMETLHARHAMYYLDVAEQGEAGLSSSGQHMWVQRLEAEHDNMRAALQWTLTEGNADLGLRLATALWPFWHMRGYLKEARAWLERALALSSTTTTSVRAKALKHAGYLAHNEADYGIANAFFEENLKVNRELGDPEGIARTLTNLGFAAVLGQQNVARIPSLLAEAMALRPEVNDRQTLAELLQFAGIVAVTEGNLEEAARWFEESLVLLRDIHDAQGESLSLISFGMLALARLDLNQATRHLTESLQLARQLGDKMPLHIGLVVLAGIAARKDEPVRAARLWGAAEALHDATGAVLFPLFQSQINHEGDITVARTQVGEEAFAAAWAAGRAMPLEQAVAYALELQPEPGPPLPPTEDT